jgi:hypothetical protein
MLTISMDRGVVRAPCLCMLRAGAALSRVVAATQTLWDAEAMAHAWTLPGLGGFVYAFATSAQHVAGAQRERARLRPVCGRLD